MAAPSAALRGTGLLSEHALRQLWLCLAQTTGPLTSPLNLLWSQTFFERVQQIVASRISGHGGCGDRRVGRFPVLRRPTSFRIEITQLDTRSGMTLGGGFLKPGKGGGIILRHTFAA